MGNSSKVSVTICCFNEERNIADCIAAVRKNQPLEIIVLDGGSTDRTVEIAKPLADKVISLPNTPLAHRRNEGIKISQGEYLAMVDADHRIPENGLEQLVAELEANRYAGVQTHLLALHHDSYWERGMEQNFILVHNHPGDRIVIGTPALYRRSVLQEIGIDGNLTAAGDDTDWCYRMKCRGYTLGVGNVVGYENVRTSFKATVKKWRWYGKGDAQFFAKYPERRMSIMLHPIKNYLIRRSFLTLKAGKPQYLPYFVVCGLSRHYGFLESMVKMGLGYLKTGSAQDKNFNYRT